MAASATAHPPKPAEKPKLRLPILPAAYTKNLIQPPKLIPVLPNPASHAFWTKLGDSIKGKISLRSEPGRGTRVEVRLLVMVNPC